MRCSAGAFVQVGLIDDANDFPGRSRFALHYVALSYEERVASYSSRAFGVWRGFIVRCAHVRTYVHRARCMPRSSFTRIIVTHSRGNTYPIVGAALYTRTCRVMKEHSALIPLRSFRATTSEKEEVERNRKRRMRKRSETREIEEKGSEKKRVRRRWGGGRGKWRKNERFFLPPCCRQLWRRSRDKRETLYIERNTAYYRRSSFELQGAPAKSRIRTDVLQAGSRSCEPRIRPLLETSTRRQG